eukprot:m.35032 g.35032  ORF g.35032 m.35032 type:complete len:786 (-) comp17074_c0_seq1:55-2412(-)
MAFFVFVWSSLSVLLVANVVGVVAETVQLPAVADSFIEREYGQFGSHPYLIVAKHTGYPKKRTVIKFDTSDTADKSIVCARVKLWFVYAHRASTQETEPWVDRKLSVGALLTPFEEMVVNAKYSSTGVAWPKTTQYPDYLDNPEVVEEATETFHRVCENNKSHWASWDVTAMAREWASGERENNGLLMWAANEHVNGRDLRFASRNYKNQSLLPYLEVAYGDVIDGSKSDCSMFDDTSHTCENPDATTAAPIPSTTTPPTPSPTIKPTPWPKPTEPTLFMSEIIEGASYNKVIELYNPTDDAIQLSDYSIHLLQNQLYDRWLPLPTKLLASGATYVMCNPDVSAQFASRCDLNSSFLQHNGDDVISLVLGDKNNITVIDQYGEPGDLTVWSVCGKERGSINNGAIRKYKVVFGNPNWKESAGTNEDDCEWIIVPGGGNNHVFTGDHDCALPLADGVTTTAMPTSPPTASAKPTVAPTQAPSTSTPTTTPEPIIVGQGEECNGSLPPPFTMLCDTTLNLVCVHDDACIGCAGLCEVATSTTTQDAASTTQQTQTQSTTSNSNTNTDTTQTASTMTTTTTTSSASSSSPSSTSSSSSSSSSATTVVAYLGEGAQCVPGGTKKNQQCNPLLSLTCVKSFFSGYGTCEKTTTPSPTPPRSSSPTSSPTSLSIIDTDASTSAAGAMVTTVVGVVVGVVVLLVLLLVVVIVLLRSKKETEEAPRDAGPSSFENPLYDETDATVVAYDNSDNSDNNVVADGYMDIPVTSFEQPQGYMDVAPFTMDSDEEEDV